MDLSNLISQQELIKKRSQIKKVFFYRICGAGMGPAAVLVKQAGFEVHGADSAYYPPMSTFLETTGIPLFKLEEVTPDFLKQYDLIVVGNSVSGKAEAARMIEKVGVPFTSFPSALGSLVLKEKNVIGIAGTHGKTTTTYFMTQLLEKLGQNPGYLVGGIIEGRDPAKLGDKYFVIESDEYDSAYFHKISKFRLYELKNLILTSLEFDHADIFSSVEKIEDEFRDVIPGMKSTLVFNQDYPSAMKLFSDYAGKNPSQKWFLYGEGSEMGPHDVQTHEFGSNFSIRWKSEKISFTSNVVGQHNVLNLTSCLIYLLSEGFGVSDLQKAAKEIGMVKRRQEVRGRYKEMIVIDDFAHHPRAISVTMDAIRARFKGRKVITIFEPISATARSSIFQNEFRDSLLTSDKIILAKASIPTTALGGKDLDVDLLAQELSSRGRPSSCVTKLEELRSMIDQYAEKDAVLLVLSNRTCLGLWESGFVKELTP
jgi:UDP-N-acetylmuramate: L-alanyl-gamma-D-glutamyl-meso-diaminopimelate ligase